MEWQELLHQQHIALFRGKLYILTRKWSTITGAPYAGRRERAEKYTQ
jgi:hypothetical protein